MTMKEKQQFIKKELEQRIKWKIKIQHEDILIIDKFNDIQYIVMTYWKMSMISHVIDVHNYSNYKVIKIIEDVIRLANEKDI